MTLLILLALLRNQGRSAVAPPNSSQYPGIQYSAVPAHGSNTTTGSTAGTILRAPAGRKPVPRCQAAGGASDLSTKILIR